MKQQNETIELETFEKRFEFLANSVFGGLHNVRRLTHHHNYKEIRLTNSLSTYDSNQLTRLVFAAHEFCLRVEIQPCTPRMIRILIHPRTREGSLMERHPTLSESVKRWNDN